MEDEKECVQTCWQTEVRNDPHHGDKSLCPVSIHLALSLSVCMEKAEPDAGLALVLMGSGIEISCLFCIIPGLGWDPGPSGGGEGLQKVPLTRG